VPTRTFATSYPSHSTCDHNKKGSGIERFNSQDLNREYSPQDAGDSIGSNVARRIEPLVTASAVEIMELKTRSSDMSLVYAESH
jgi:hypothetical protein